MVPLKGDAQQLAVEVRRRRLLSRRGAGRQYQSGQCLLRPADLDVERPIGGLPRRREDEGLWRLKGHEVGIGARRPPRHRQQQSDGQ